MARYRVGTLLVISTATLACGGRTSVELPEDSSLFVAGGGTHGAVHGGGGRTFGAAGQGGSSGTQHNTAGSGTCMQHPAQDPWQVASHCRDARVLVAERLPTELVLLMARPPFTGMGRWDALTSGIELFSGLADEAQRASMILFGKTELSDDANCIVASYETPAVPTANWSEAEPLMGEVMRNAKPADASPLVPALAGALRYAAERQSRAIWHEVVLVMVGDGVPTSCLAEYAVDATTVIAQARQSKPAVRSFFIGVGEVELLDSMRPTFVNYARIGGSNAPFLLDESKGLSYLSSQLAMALLGIVTSPSSSAFRIVPESQVTTVDLTRIELRVQSGSSWYDVPFVASERECAESKRGGWYHPDPAWPNRLRLCPCSDELLGKGSLHVVAGCGAEIAPQ